MKTSLGPKTLIYPNPVLVIGTYDRDGKPNMMTASWAGICSSDPPCLNFSIRKSRHTFDAIFANRAFTVNIPAQMHLTQADYCGMYSGKDENKFETCNLTPVHSELVNAPFVKEFPVNLICKLEHSINLGIHTMVIGQILDVLANSDVLDDNGTPDIRLISPFVYDYSTRSYYGVGNKLASAYSSIKKREY